MLLIREYIDNILKLQQISSFTFDFRVANLFLMNIYYR